MALSTQHHKSKLWSFKCFSVFYISRWSHILHMRVIVNARCQLEFNEGEFGILSQATSSSPPICHLDCLAWPSLWGVRCHSDRPPSPLPPSQTTCVEPRWWARWLIISLYLRAGGAQPLGVHNPFPLGDLAYPHTHAASCASSYTPTPPMLSVSHTLTHAHT